jgi:hypothetical protein
MTVTEFELSLATKTRERDSSAASFEVCVSVAQPERARTPAATMATRLPKTELIDPMDSSLASTAERSKSAPTLVQDTGRVKEIPGFRFVDRAEAKA